MGLIKRPAPLGGAGLSMAGAWTRGRLSSAAQTLARIVLKVGLGRRAAEALAGSGW